MINIDLFTLGNEFKDDNGAIYKVTSNFSENGRIFVELTKVEPAYKEKLVDE